MECWLSCDTFEGMFSTEVGVSAKTADGREFSFFVDKDLMREDNGEGQAFVSVLAVPNQGDEEYLVVLLPRQPSETGSYVKVKRDQVKAEVAA